MLERSDKKINDLENEIAKMKSKNIHQGNGFKLERNYLENLFLEIYCFFRYTRFTFKIKNWKNFSRLQMIILISCQVSCQEYADIGEYQNGSYRVQPYSNMTRINIKSIFELFKEFIFYIKQLCR